MPAWLHISLCGPMCFEMSATLLHSLLAELFGGSYFIPLLLKPIPEEQGKMLISTTTVITVIAIHKQH